MEGFFSLGEVEVKPRPSTVPKCGSCGLHLKCNSPKMSVAGDGRKGVMVVGEAPGEREDERGRPFVGPAGQELCKHLAKLGVDLFKDCWVTNALICRPPSNVIDNEDKIDFCRPNVYNAIRLHKPRTIVLLGSVAVKSVIGWLWKDNPGGVTRWAGFRIPSQELNAWVCPTYHPSFVLRERERRPVVEVIFQRQLKNAFSLEERPWQTAPDYKSRIVVCLDDREAAIQLTHLVDNTDGPLALDYETTMLKPEGERARIVCCAVSDGKSSVAFLWQGLPVEIMRGVLKERPMIAANLQFEERWTRHEFGFGVKAWNFDTMVAAHVLDNRKEVSGLKFQAFARLGQPEYDRHVRDYLKSRAGGGYGENRVEKCPKRDLLEYCGMDALLEYELAAVQRRDLRIDK